jgi:hypothetical protein
VKPRTRTTWVCLLAAYTCLGTPASADPKSTPTLSFPQWLCSASNTWDASELSNLSGELATAPLPALPLPPFTRMRALPYPRVLVTPHEITVDGEPAMVESLSALSARPLVAITGQTSAEIAFPVIAAIANNPDAQGAVFAFSASDAVSRPDVSKEALAFAASQGARPTITQMGGRFEAVLGKCPTTVDHRLLEQADKCLEFADATTRLLKWERCDLEEPQVYGVLSWALGRGAADTPMSLWEVDFSPTTEGTVFALPSQTWAEVGPRIAEGATWFELGSPADHLADNPHHRVESMLTKRPTKVRPVKGLPVTVFCHFDVFVDEQGAWQRNAYSDCPPEFHETVNAGFSKATWYPHQVAGEAVPAQFPFRIRFR